MERDIIKAAKAGNTARVREILEAAARVLEKSGATA